MTKKGRRITVVGAAASATVISLISTAPVWGQADPRLGRDAFSFPRADMPAAETDSFNRGRGLFRQPWVVAPSPADGAVDGLGPLHNRLSCVACHPRNGRGAPPERPDEPLRSALVRLSVAVGDGWTAAPHPAYGDQLNTDAVPGAPPEGKANVVWREERREVLADGTVVGLRRPQLRLSALNYGPVGDDLLTSLRVAPAVFGLGLLENVPVAALVAVAKAQPTQSDGVVAGRLNYILDEKGIPQVGRFGLKANQPSLIRQNAGAFIGDLGITSALFPRQNCTPVQTACAAQPHGGEPELSATQLADVTRYVFWLAPPPRRGADTPQVRQGEAAFHNAGCAVCHRPDLAGVAAYSDLLLHDMGEGLADGRPDHLADGRQWRTTPLWGLGSVGVVGENPRYLHDGRARDLTEAVMWHGGEAGPAREAFRNLPAAARDALTAFLNSL
jgi:CxxC motif-containing protein (DUF1111 family)